MFEELLREFLFADNCALDAHTHVDMACRRFGLTISLGKTEFMFQEAPSCTKAPPPPPITIDGTELKSVEKFCYLGSTVCSNGSLDAEIALRISKASSAFGRLSKRLWQVKGIRLCTKIATYKAVVLSALLYCSETWTPSYQAA